MDALIGLLCKTTWRGSLTTNAHQTYYENKRQFATNNNSYVKVAQ